MAQAFQFELVSPERLLLSAQVTEVVIPGSEGYLTALAGHSPLMTTIMPGVVSVKLADGKTDSYVVFGGFADITPQAAPCWPNPQRMWTISTRPTFSTVSIMPARCWKMPRRTNIAPRRKSSYISS
ncbi:F0F1 ATP synthase subunit epsilon [Brucella ceti TE28753-12]|nr:F0F1 ATP synthase subunit epsilon [Brucella ceti TE28753-12]